MPSFVDLNIEIIHLVCQDLLVNDVLNLRLTCRFLDAATRSKIVWIHQMEKLEAQSSVLPSNAQDYRLLQPSLLETLVLRLTFVGDKWLRQDMTPTATSTISVPGSITWLHIFDGRYVFVAFSDRKASSIACWDLWLLQAGYPSAATEAFLVGRVNTAQVEMQEDGIVLALGLDGETQSVVVVTLQVQEDTCRFYELARIGNSSHVLLLDGSIIGCAIRDGLNVPHLVDWRSGTIREIPAPSGGLETPGNASVPHLLAISGETLAIVRSVGIEIYWLTTETIVFVRHIVSSTIWEAVASTAIGFSALQLTLITRVGLETLVIDDRVLDMNLETPALLCIFPAPLCGCCGPSQSCDFIYHKAPWYHLSVGSSGRRCMWVSVGNGSGNNYATPRLMSAKLPSPVVGSLDTTSAEIVSWPVDSMGDFALWALPRLHFDEALGTVVIGNCFGELDFHNVDQHLVPCFSLARYPFWTSGHLLTQVSSASPMDVDAVDAPSPVSLHSLPEITAKWSQDSIVHNISWSTDWAQYRKAHLWEGAPCDLGWILHEAFGFPGRVIPQGYANRWDSAHEQALFFRVGRRYFVLREGDENEFHCAPLDPGDADDLFFHLRRSPKLITTRRTAITARQAYMMNLLAELDSPAPLYRNRWLEMQERGAFVEWKNIDYQFIGHYLD